MTRKIKNQKRKERRERKKLMDSLERSAYGYYITKEKAVKLKTYKEIGSEWVQAEEVKLIPVKKYIPPSRQARELLTKIYENKLNNAKPPERNILEVVFSGENPISNY